MNKKILISMLTVVVLVSPVIVFAQSNGGGGGGTTLTGITGTLKTTLITIGGSVVIIGWIIAGILYLTAAGDPSKLGIAKNALIACVIGTVLVILADASSTIISVIKSALGLT